MPKVTYIANSGETTTIDVPAGRSVMEGAVKNGIEGIVAECGGACMCATCHVYVDDGWLGKLRPMDEEQDEMLNSTAAERKSNSRLSCQIEMRSELDGLTVRMPDRQV
jgi:2Fe-2S ferredoxin